jgi:ATP-dependent Clp protease protease subunit
MDRLLRNLAFVSVIVAAVTFGWFLTQLWQHVQDPYWLFESQMDAEIEARLEPDAIDPADPLLARRRILLTTAVNEQAVQHVVSRLLYLDAADPAAPIDLFLSTTGGWRDAAFAIVDAMRLITAPVNTWALGGCYSAGAIVLAGGTGTRSATPNSLLMVHANVEDSAEEFSSGQLGVERESRFWMEHARLPKQWFPLTSDTTYYLSPEQALEYGIVDAVRTTPLRGAGSAVAQAYVK